MVSNINLVATETESRAKMSGKSSLIISVLLLFLAIAAYIILNYFANNYKSRQTDAENKILVAKNKMTGADFVDIADFQGRLSLLSAMSQDRLHFDTYLKEMSKYVLPDVHFTSLDWKSSDQSIDIKGFSPNFNSLSQALILLKQYPELQSLEFKKANEASVTGSEQSGVQFELSAKLKPVTLNK